MFKKLLEKLGIIKTEPTIAKSTKEQQKLKKETQNKKESDQFYKDMETGILDDDFKV